MPKTITVELEWNINFDEVKEFNHYWVTVQSDNNFYTLEAYYDDILNRWMESDGDNFQDITKGRVIAFAEQFNIIVQPLLTKI